MKIILMLLLFLPSLAQAKLLFQYDLNYATEKDSTKGSDYEKSRTFHKAFLGAAINGDKTVFFGWNINSWSSSLKYQTNAEETYSMLEMGPKLQWFFSDEYHWYLDTEWNPYAKGDREKAGVKQKITGSSFGVGFGYRFKLSRLIGLGASIHYHSLAVKEQKIGNTVTDVSDNVNAIMPMLELSILTK